MILASNCFLPVNVIIEPGERRVNAAVQWPNGIQKRAANIGHVATSEFESVANFITVGVLHIKPDGQFE